MSAASTFTSLNALATHLRHELENKKFILLYAYNGTGKTRLSTAFKDLGKSVNAEGETDKRDTLSARRSGPSPTNSGGRWRRSKR
jgi:hypothetical protein